MTVNCEFLLDSEFVTFVKERQRIPGLFKNETFINGFNQIKDPASLLALCSLFSKENFSVFLETFKDGVSKINGVSKIIRSNHDCMILARGLADNRDLHNIFIDHFVCSNFLKNKSPNEYVEFFNQYPTEFRTRLLKHIKQYTFNGQGEKLAFIQKFSPEYYQALVQLFKSELQQDFDLPEQEQHYEAITHSHDSALIGTLWAAGIELKNPPAFVMPQNLQQLIQVMERCGVTDRTVEWAHNKLENLKNETIKAIKSSNPTLTAFLDEYAKKYQFKTDLGDLFFVFKNCTDDNRASFLNCVDWSSLMTDYSLCSMIPGIKPDHLKESQIVDSLISQLVRYKKKNTQSDCTKWFKETPQLLAKLAKDKLKTTGKELLLELIAMDISRSEMSHLWSEIDINTMRSILEEIPEAQSYLLQFCTADQCWVFLTSQTKVTFLLDNPHYILTRQFIGEAELVMLMEDQSVPLADRNHLIATALTKLGPSFYERHPKLSIKALQAVQSDQEAFSRILFAIDARCAKNIREDLVRINELEKEYTQGIANNTSRYQGTRIIGELESKFKDFMAIGLIGSIICGVLAGIFLAPLIAGSFGPIAAVIGIAAVGGALFVLAIDLITGLFASIANSLNSNAQSCHTKSRDTLIADYGSEEDRNALLEKLKSVNDPAPEHSSNRNSLFNPKIKQAPDLRQTSEEDMGCVKGLCGFGA